MQTGNKPPTDTNTTNILENLSVKPNVSLWQEFINSIYARALLTIVLFFALFATTFWVAARTQEQRNFEQSANPNVVPEAEIQVPTTEPQPTQAPTATVGEGCAIGGCGGELCGEEADELVSTCVFRPSDVCYQTAVCKRQVDGTCGWTQTDELTSCLAQY
jgi:hypothetical protein